MSLRYIVSIIGLILLFLHGSEGSHLTGMDYSDSRQKPHFLGKVLMAAILTALCIFVLKQSPSFSGDIAVGFQTSTYIFVDQIMTIGCISFFSQFFNQFVFLSC